MREVIERVNSLGSPSGRPQARDEDYETCIPFIAQKGLELNDVEARALIILISGLFRKSCELAGFSSQENIGVRTKFRDAGRRSAPWRPTSSVVPGRPQDGADGNRINRWLLPPDHKFFATEKIATLVEVKYYLQALSMQNAPPVLLCDIRNIFTPWLVEHPIVPGAYQDPIQLIPIDFRKFASQRRSVQSGHVHPLDRGGIHHPDNTFLMLFRSNQIQGNLTIEELLTLMRTIVNKHDNALQNNSALEAKLRGRGLS